MTKIVPAKTPKFSAVDAPFGPPRPSPIVEDLDLTIFVACYNEEDNILETLETLLAALREFPALKWEVLVIDDCSRDRSVELIKEWLARHAELPFYLRVNSRNMDLAYNYIEGAFWGRGKYYRLVCGDNVEPKETLVEMLKHLGVADIVIFYQEQIGRSPFRAFLSRSFTHLINLISGNRLQYYNGLAIHRRYNVMRWNTSYHGHGFQADIITRLLDAGCNYAEVNVRVTERPKGKSKALRLKNWLSVAHTLLDLSIRRIGRTFFNR